MAHKHEKEEVVWTPDMPDRRLSDRRSGFERRQTVGQALHVPTPRNNLDRREGRDRRRMSLTITGRAMSAGFSRDEEE